MRAFLSILKRNARNSAPFTYRPLSRLFSPPNVSQREREHGVIFGGQRDRQSQGPNYPGPVMGKSRSQLPPRGLNAKDKANVKLILINFFFNHSLHFRVLIVRQEEMSLRTRVLSKWKLWLKENRERAPRGPRQWGKDGEGGHLTFGAVVPCCSTCVHNVPCHCHPPARVPRPAPSQSVSPVPSSFTHAGLYTSAVETTFYSHLPSFFNHNQSRFRQRQHPMCLQHSGFLRGGGYASLACKVLIPWPGIEPRPSVRAES